MRILVVEDDFVSRNVMSRLLAPLGEVQTAEDGKKGFELFQRAQAKGQPFDLVTLDVMMPNMDGHATLDAIRGLERDQHIEQRTRVLMTTALDDVKNVNAAFRSLCDDYLVKPIRKQALFEKIASFGLPVPKS